MRATGMAALAVALAVPAGAWAEVPDAYGLLTRGEFAALTGRAELSDPEAMTLGEGSVCGFGNGQIVLFAGEGSAAAFDRLLARSGQLDLPRTPVEGLGPAPSCCSSTRRTRTRTTAPSWSSAPTRPRWR